MYDSVVGVEDFEDLEGLTFGIVVRELFEVEVLPSLPLVIAAANRKSYEEGVRRVLSVADVQSGHPLKGGAFGVAPFDEGLYQVVIGSA